MAGLRQFSRGTATRPILRAPDVSTDSAEQRAIGRIFRDGRKERVRASNRPSSLAAVLAGRKLRGTPKGGVWNGPVGEQ